MHCITLALLPVLALGSVIDAFVSGKEGYHTYRIPSLLQLSNGDLLLFCEGRKYSSADHDYNDILTKRSTDGGATWGPVQIVHSESTDSKHVVIGNPSPVELTEGELAIPGRVLLVFTRNNADVGKTMSEDYGATWGPVEYFSDQLDLPKGLSHIGTGPPTAVQLASGRVVVPANYCTGGAPMKCGSGTDLQVSLALISDDLENWHRSALVPEGNECQIAHAPNGSLVMNMRDGVKKERQFAWSHDDGETWSDPITSPFNDRAFAGGACEGSTIVMKGSDVLLFSTPFAGSRANLTVFSSSDSGASWQWLQLVDAGQAAYSSLASINATHAALVYEAEHLGSLRFLTIDINSQTQDSQRWQLNDDKSLSTDGQYCLDWTSKADASGHHAVYMNLCSVEDHAHQRWQLLADGHLTTDDANGLALDWTSKSSTSGGHTVYMNKRKSALAHQQWHFETKTLTSQDEDGLCLEARAAGRGLVEMRPCASKKVLI